MPGNHFCNDAKMPAFASPHGAITAPTAFSPHEYARHNYNDKLHLQEDEAVVDVNSYKLHMRKRGGHIDNKLH